MIGKDFAHDLRHAPKISAAGDKGADMNHRRSAVCFQDCFERVARLLRKQTLSR